MEKLSEIIKIPEIKLVVQLSDADSTPDDIINSFVFTDEVLENINLILNKIENNQGSGIFIKGNFGSGKSHFLSYIYLLLKNKNSINSEMIKKYPKILENDINIVKVSLVKYPSNNSLEKILLSLFQSEGEIFDRDKYYKELFNKKTAIIIDELSEFLRSKPNPQAFYEDIRFLQYLGEFSFENPLWIIATLQEWIEETGHISSSIFNRIKDRYPIRITLTSSHIEDIIDKRVVIKIPEKEEAIKKSFDEINKYFPKLQLKYPIFVKTYPLHPVTVKYLSGLTPIFSQHRGVIHFIVSEVKKILDEPYNHLLTPDIIFDHFEDRIKEIPEYSSLVRIVYDYYKQNINAIINRENLALIALSIIKIMILTEISPYEKKKSAKDLAEILLKKISSFSSDINYEFIKEGILEVLVGHQMYIKKEGETYYIDSSINEGIKIKSRIKAVREKFQDRNYFFNVICNIINLQYLPLNSISEGKKYSFVWQNSLRECSVFIENFVEIKNDDIKRMVEGCETKIDGYFVIFSPFTKNVNFVKDLNNNFKSPYLSTLLFWSPKTLTEEEVDFAETYCAKYILREEFPVLSVELKSKESELKELITKLYFEGDVVYGNGQTENNLSNIGYLPFERLLSYLFENSFNALYPKHNLVMSKIDYFTTTHLKSLFTSFIKIGKISIEESEKKGLTSYIKGIMEPLGIVKKKSGSYFLSLESDNELVSLLLNLCSNENNIFNIRLSLKKGVYGLSDDQFNLLTLSAIAVGFLQPFQNDNVCEIKDYNDIYNTNILRSGKTLSSELLPYLKNGDFIWGEVEDIPTPATRNEMWKKTQTLIRKSREILEEIKLFSTRYQGYSVMNKMNINYNILNKLNNLFKELTINSAPDEGLTNVLSYVRENENFENEIKYLNNLHVFFVNNFQILSKYYLYLTNREFSGNENIIEEKNVIIAKIEEYLSNLDENFGAIRELWEKFYDNFTSFYVENHNEFYSNPLFKKRQTIEQSREFKTLYKISSIVNSGIFENDYYSLRRYFEKLPSPCREDLNRELFVNPVCRCGYKYGKEITCDNEDDIPGICRSGIINFIKFLQEGQTREKIESYLLSNPEKNELSSKIRNLLNLSCEKINLDLLMNDLSDEILKEIEYSLKNNFKVKEVKIKDILGKISNRKIKYADLKKIFFEWAGADEEAIIFIKEENDNKLSQIGETLKKYKQSGDKILTTLTGEDNLSEEKIEKIFSEINLNSFNSLELLNLLKEEENKILLRKIRSELFDKISGKYITEDFTKNITDKHFLEITNILKLSYSDTNYKGIDYFTEVISPFNLALEKLKEQNSNEDYFDYPTITKLENLYKEKKVYYKNLSNKYENALPLETLKEKIKDVVVVFDCLRYDLYLLLKESILKTGANIYEKSYRVEIPTTTANFRKLLNIENETGTIGSRTYILEKFAEKNINKRNLKKIATLEKDVKFLHFNFIDAKIHSSTINLFSLYSIIKNEFETDILPLLNELPSYYLISDHGFVDNETLQDRYTHGGNSDFETILPAVCVKNRMI